MSLRNALVHPASLLMLVFGFSSGLPFLLVGGTLSVWLKQEAVSVEIIGLFSLLGLSYSLKFLWAPLIDHLRLPLVSRLGQRRSWLLAAQLLLVASLAGMALIGPQSAGVWTFVALTALSALAGATQDVVIDAWRIEAAPLEHQGTLAAVMTLGYRLALLFSGAFALFLADHIDWMSIYLIMAATVAALMIATVLAREPDVQARLQRAPLRDAVIGPFRDFMQRYPGRLGVGLVIFIGLFKLSDQLLGVMAFPFYLDCGFSTSQIAAVSKLIGVWIGIAGAFIGGACVIRFGVHASLLTAIILAGVSNLLYVVLAQFPGNLWIFTLVILGENLSGGMLGSAAVAFLSSLVDQRFTATQYALFSSLVTLPGKLLGGGSGYLVKYIGYDGFFIITTLAAVPSLLLYAWLKPRLNEQRS